MVNHEEPARPSHPSSGREAADGSHVTLRSPAELADALPYLLGYHPDDSIVMIALHGDRGRFGGRLRTGIPADPEEWPSLGEQLAETLVAGCTRRGTRPDGVVLYLCRDPAADGTGREVMEALRPLAQALRLACGGLDVPVFEALCVSGGRFWSYCCSDARCCPPEGTPLAIPGTSVMAAAAAYAGVQVVGSLRQLEARFAPPGGGRAEAQRRALDTASAELVPRILSGPGADTVRRETLELADQLVRRLHQAPAAAGPADQDARDDGLVTDAEAAAILTGLQDRATRDDAAAWMEGPRAGAVLRLWRALARRCVPPYTEHAAAPLALAGWVAWSTGGIAEARVALGLALSADPHYLFARLLHQACNEGMDPERLRRCLRRDRPGRAGPAGSPGTSGTSGTAGGPPAEGTAGHTPPAPLPPKPAARRAKGGAPGGPTAPEAVNRPAGKPRSRRHTGRRGLRDRR
ncbi:DUF4192 domain-containing protein [Streptomyces orinoci]|uniref:DUF4192 domain-containing protein n=1 Tax=Streptomyces orinoci TaxID=67339 RepID=A0ABV3K2F9_STRON|nr:DUF4192 domain-containing protein [Streptomyces orinoci]